MILLGLASGRAYSQEPLLRFHHIPPEESFAPNFLTDIAQDDQGFMWFSSLNGGIARYDGYEFKVYRYDPADPDSLPSNQATSVFADPLGGVWMGTKEGLAWLDPDTDRLTIYRHVEGDESSIIDSYISTIFRDSRGTLWVGTVYGLARLDRGSGSFINYPLVTKEDEESGVITPNWVWEIYEDSEGTVWFGTLGGGLLRYDRETGAFERFTADPDDPTKLFTGAIRAIFEDSSKTLWVGTDAGLARMVDRERGVFQHVPIHGPKNSGWGEDGPVGSIAEDQFGNLWLTTGAGGMVRLAGTDRFQAFSHQADDATSLGPGRPWNVFVDRGGTIWIGTDVINRLVPTALAFSMYRAPKPIRNEPMTVNIDSAGVLWVPNSRAEGLLSFDPATGQWQSHLPYPDKLDDDSNWIRGPGAIESADGTLWVTTTAAIHKLDRASNTFSSRDLPVGPNALTTGSDGLLWLALPFNGLASFDFETNELNQYRHDPEDETTVSEDFGFVVLEDSSGWIWYGSIGGLDRFDRSTGTAMRFQHVRDEPGSLSNSGVLSALEDSRGRLWFGTDFGLNRYVPEREEFIRHHNGASPAQNVIVEILEANDEYLWLGTSAGIARFEIETGAFENWTASDGIPAGWTGYIQLGADGAIYSLIPKGIVEINVDLLDAPSSPPPVVLTEFRIGNHPVAVSTATEPTPLERQINRADELTLRHQDRMVSIGFSALDYSDPRSNRYEYRMGGMQDEWIPTDSRRRIATFTDLAPGNYLFQVRGSNKDGVWNEAGIRLPITMLPPPWRTWWAYVLYMITALALILAFTHWRTRTHRIHAAELKTAVDERTAQLQASETRVRQQSEDLEQLLELKERLFANISHEFRTPLTLMLGPVEHAREATANPVIAAQLGMARRNGRRVLRLVDQLLELSKLTSEEQPVREPQPVGPVATTVVDAFRPLTRQNEVALKLSVDDSLWTEVPAETLERVLMNLLSNAVKFTGPQGSIKVEIAASEAGEAVEIRVSDTGVGIPQERQAMIFERFQRVDERGERVPGSGVGLALVREIVETYDGSIQVISTPGQGTQFTVTLPRLQPPEGLKISRDAPVSEALKLEIDALEQPGEESAGEGADVNHERPHVLVIEDNADMRAYLTQLLDMEYRIATADTGELGLQTAEQDVPDLIVCDLMLPGMDGFEVVQKLRSDERTSHIPIIMLTARSDDESRLEALREHVDDYLIKPFNDEELMLRIANVLAIRDILRARFGGALIAGEEPRESLKQPERRFLEKLQGVLETYYANEDFSVASMASEMAMSERQLQRKLKAITDQTPALYLRLFRLRRSLDLLADGRRVSDVAFDVGFSSPAYFSNCFRAQFACTPSEFQADPSAIRL